MQGARVCLFLCATAVAIPACGGGGDDLDDKAITELSDEDMIEACESFNDDLPDPDTYIEAVCRVGGIMVGMQGGDCQMTIDDCLAEPPFDPPEAEDCSTAPDDEIPDCPDTTVGDIRACNQAQVDQLAEAAALTCDDSIDSFEELPAECLSLMEECPALFGEASARQLWRGDAIRDSLTVAR